MSFRSKLTVFNKSKLNLSLVTETQCICINTKHMGKNLDLEVPLLTLRSNCKIDFRIQFNETSSSILFVPKNILRIFTNDVNAF